MILNQAQAEAVYSAMCALNNVGMVLDSFCEAESLHVREISNGAIVIHKTPGSRLTYAISEQHTDQSAFARAYNIEGAST